MSELQKAYEDMLIYGTGAVSVEGDEVKHVPAEEIMTYEKCEAALKIFHDTAIEGDVVIFDEVSGETYQATIGKQPKPSLGAQPMNRKQRRIQASKDRRNGKNKV